MMKLKGVGYWQSKADSSLPRPESLVDARWDPDERTFVLEYLGRGHPITAALGASLCRVCGAPIGSQDVTDGEFVWPEGLSHYLAEHDVRPPAAFIDGIRSRLADLETTEVDLSWWQGHAE